MNDRQTPDADDSVQLHFTTSHGRAESLSVSIRAEQLDLSRRAIESIDLSPLSSRSNLKTLDFGGNQLDHIDLSPLSSCGSLETVALWGNQLESICLSPLSSCGSLQTIWLGDNNLDTVDLSPLSSCGSLQTLWFNGNRLQTVDLSPLASCRSLASLNLETNSLRSIDLTPLSSCSNLQTILLDDNQFQSIDLSPLSSCGRLESLWLSENQLQSIDLTPLLSSSSCLESLTLANNKLHSIDLTPLSICIGLHEFHLLENQIKDVRCLLDRETIGLLLPVLDEELAYLRLTWETEHLCGPDVAFLARVVDAWWHTPHPEDRWKAHAVAQDVLSNLGFGWLGLIDADPETVMAVVNDTDDQETLTKRLVGLLCQQIDRGGTTDGVDIDSMTQNVVLAARVPRMLELRRTEMEQVVVAPSQGEKLDLCALWLTAYGHMLLSSLGLGTICTRNELEMVKGASVNLGFKLTETDEALVFSSNVSERLKEYIWELADLRREKKR